MSRMLIVEDNALFRQSLKSILCRRFPFMDVGESAGGNEVLQKIDLRRPLIDSTVMAPPAHGRFSFVGKSIIIEDNGQGFDLGDVSSRSNVMKGLGLSSVRERIGFSGGSFSKAMW